MKAFKLLIIAALFSPLSTALFAEDAKTQTEKNALEIRIAKLDLNNVPLDQAVAKVMELSKEGDPDKKGISILLDKEALASPVKTISLNLKDVPVSDVIRLMAALSGLQPKYEEKAVILMPSTPAS